MYREGINGLVRYAKVQEPPAIGECINRVIESVGLVAHGLHDELGAVLISNA